MKSKKTKKNKKGGSGINLLFTGFDMNNINKLMVKILIIGVVLVIFLLFVIGLSRLQEMYNKLTRYTFTIIEDLVRSDETNQPTQQQQSTSTITPPQRQEGIRQRPNFTPPRQLNFDIEEGGD